MPRRMKEKHKTYGNVFDEFTIHNLEKLRSKGIIDEMISPIFVGKESNVFTATAGGRGGESETGPEGGAGGENKRVVVVKIYRLENCDFNKMYEYIKHDFRYPHLRKYRRNVIFSWVHREYRNLLKAREIGVRVPTPIAFLNNILILELIGDRTPAPRVKDLLPKDPPSFFEEIVACIKKMHKGNLIHGDLSQYNILNWNDRPIFIDFSQATTRENPFADEYLARDCKNICAFFTKLGVECDAETVEKEIFHQKKAKP